MYVGMRQQREDMHRKRMNGSLTCVDHCNEQFGSPFRLPTRLRGSMVSFCLLFECSQDFYVLLFECRRPWQYYKAEHFASSSRIPPTLIISLTASLARLYMSFMSSPVLQDTVNTKFMFTQAELSAWMMLCDRSGDYCLHVCIVCSIKLIQDGR